MIPKHERCHHSSSLSFFNLNLKWVNLLWVIGDALFIVVLVLHQGLLVFLPHQMDLQVSMLLIQGMKCWSKSLLQYYLFQLLGFIRSSIHVLPGCYVLRILVYILCNIGMSPFFNTYMISSLTSSFVYITPPFLYSHSFACLYLKFGKLVYMAILYIFYYEFC